MAVRRMRFESALGAIGVAAIVLGGCEDNGLGLTTGDLLITTATTGLDIDPQGYVVVLDDVESQPIGPTGAVTFENLTGGPHVVELTEVPANCSVGGENPRILAAGSGETLAGRFEVTCMANLGTVEVLTSSAGVGVPDGYRVTVDDTINVEAGAHDTVVVEGVPAGETTIELTLPVHCTVEGDNPRTVMVSFTDVASTTFQVSCGGLEVVTSTEGGDLDPDGYVVVVDGTITSPIGVNDAVTMSDVAPGDRWVELTDVAANCTVIGDNPRTVAVPVDDRHSITFDVQCDPQGDLQVTTSSTGLNLPDLTVVLNGSSSLAVGPNGSVVFEGAPAGDQTLELSDLPPHCDVVNGTNPRTVTVAGGAGATTFELQCWAWLVFDSNRAGEWDIFIMRHDGADQTNLTDFAAAPDRQPVASPDGTKVAFTSERSGKEQVHVLDRETGEVTQLTNLNRAKEPYWSPDGSKIAFSARETTDWDIWIMNPDGSNQENLTDYPGLDGRPEWSLDGTKLVFDSDRDGARGIFVMNADGSGVQRLTTGNDWNPTWSPDRTRIAFTSFRGGGAGDVWVMDADGSNLENLTMLPGSLAGEAAWSADGTTIAFMSEHNGPREIYLMDPDGSNVRQVTSNFSDDMWPSWVPLP